MRVAILGATGRVGSRALDAALGVGHEVVLLTRSADAPHRKGVTVVTGSAGDLESVQQAIGGSGAVIAALGPRHNRLEDELALEAAMQNIVRAMTDAGISRLVALSGAGISVDGDRKPVIDRLVARFVRAAARHVVGAKEREFAVFSASDLEWTALRPAIVTDGEARGYRLSLDLRPGARTTRADVGQALVDQVSDGAFIRQAPFVLPAGS